MKLLQLTAIVRDAQTATMIAQSFTRSPVLVGRQYGNQLRLDARIVSRRHGAFLFSKDGLQYIDYDSANGSYVDGDPHRAQPADRHSRFVGDHDRAVPDRRPHRSGRHAPAVQRSERVDAGWWRCCAPGPRRRSSVRGSTFSTTARRCAARARRASRASSGSAPRASRDRRGADAGGREPDRADAVAAASGRDARRDGRAAARSGAVATSGSPSFVSCSPSCFARA